MNARMIPSLKGESNKISSSLDYAAAPNNNSSHDLFLVNPTLALSGGDHLSRKASHQQQQQRDETVSVGSAASVRGNAQPKVFQFKRQTSA